MARKHLGRGKLFLWEDTYAFQPITLCCFVVRERICTEKHLLNLPRMEKYYCKAFYKFLLVFFRTKNCCYFQCQSFSSALSLILIPYYLRSICILHILLIILCLAVFDFFLYLNFSYLKEYLRINEVIYLYIFLIHVWHCFVSGKHIWKSGLNSLMKWCLRNTTHVCLYVRTYI